ncbi:hypothetical protein [Cupriavidus sp. YAF13]
MTWEVSAALTLTAMFIVMAVGSYAHYVWAKKQAANPIKDDV